MQTAESGGGGRHTAVILARTSVPSTESVSISPYLGRRTTLTLISAVWRSGDCQQSDDLIDGLVGAVVGGFELAVWAMFCIGLVVEAAVGEWPAQP